MNGTFRGLSAVRPVVVPTPPREFRPNDPAGTTYALTYESKDGQVRSGEVARTALVFLNGQPCTLDDIKSGDVIELSGVPATQVIVTRDTSTEATEEVRMRTLKPAERASAHSVEQTSASSGFRESPPLHQMGQQSPQQTDHLPLHQTTQTPLEHTHESPQSVPHEPHQPAPRSPSQSVPHESQQPPEHPHEPTQPRTLHRKHGSDK